MAQKSKEKAKIAVLIGAGSKLPAIIKAAAKPSSNFEISVVVSHKADSPGVKLATQNKIPAFYFKLPDFRKRLFGGSEASRPIFMKTLGWQVSQREYAPNLLIFAGWDLVMDKNFFQFFKAKFGSGYAAINLHPGLLPKKSEGSSIKLPDGTETPVVKGELEDVLKDVLKTGVTYFGPTIHFMVADDFDTGEVVRREFIKVSKKDTVDTLRKKLMPVEDEILTKSIGEVIKKYIKK